MPPRRSLLGVTAILVAGMLTHAPAAALAPPVPPGCDERWQRPIAELAERLATTPANDWPDVQRSAELHCPFARIGRANPDEAVPLLIRLAADTSATPPVRDYALHSLMNFGAYVARDLPRLFALLEPLAAEPQHAAMTTNLWRVMAAADPRLVPRLLERQKVTPSTALLRALGAAGHDDPAPVLPALIARAAEPAWRAEALDALLALGIARRTDLFEHGAAVRPPTELLLALFERAVAEPATYEVDGLGRLLAGRGAESPARVVALLMATLAGDANGTRGAGALTAFGARARVARPLLMRKLAQPLHAWHHGRLLEALAAVDGDSPATLEYLLAEATERNDAVARRLLSTRGTLPASFAAPLRRALVATPDDDALREALRNAQRHRR